MSITRVWLEGSTRIESLKAGYYPGLLDFKDAIVDELTFRRKLRFNFKGYRGYARFLMNEEEILLYEYDLMGEFMIYRIPLDEIDDVRMVPNITPADIEIIRIGGGDVRFQTNVPEYFHGVIMEALTKFR